MKLNWNELYNLKGDKLVTWVDINHQIKLQINLGLINEFKVLGRLFQSIVQDYASDYGQN